MDPEIDASIANYCYEKSLNVSVVKKIFYNRFQIFISQKANRHIQQMNAFRPTRSPLWLMALDFFWIISPTPRNYPALNPSYVLDLWHLRQDSNVDK